MNPFRARQSVNHRFRLTLDRLPGEPLDRSVDRSMDRSMDRITDRLTERLRDRLQERMMDRQRDRRFVDRVDRADRSTERRRLRLDHQPDVERFMFNMRILLQRHRANFNRGAGDGVDVWNWREPPRATGLMGEGDGYGDIFAPPPRALPPIA
ncbi:serine/threonine-protein kinase fray2 [Drosophila ficusphila]|uniref:serine/threonine-protein kinase fray2 n=1 Tax=Drosophila ficusphila TaxID=30025 RepID=UPI0007E7458F|nr:serine/threonine-protein kinase fray2 [Drosophila ficusphila]